MLFHGVKSIDDHAIGLQRQRLANRGRAPLDRTCAVQNTDFPADFGRRFLDTGCDAEDASILQVTGDDNDGLAHGGLGTGGWAVELLGHGKPCTCQRRGKGDGDKVTSFHDRILPVWLFLGSALSALGVACNADCDQQGYAVEHRLDPE